MRISKGDRSGSDHLRHARNHGPGEAETLFAREPDPVRSGYASEGHGRRWCGRAGHFSHGVLGAAVQDPRFETALMRSYNTWMAGVCKQKSDRLKWAGVLPMRFVPEAVEEVRRCKELGAVATAVFGTVGEKLLSHEDFDPVWAEAERLKIPVCVHTGWCHPGLKRPFTDSYGAHVLGFTLPVLIGFFAFLGGGILDRFPRIKVAFLEAGADWVPYLIERMDHYFHSETANNRPLPKRRATDYVRDCQVYFTCEAEEKLLPQVMGFVGEDRIMISADMPHGEAREGSVEEIKERNDLSQVVKQRILGDNAARFYNI